MEIIQREPNEGPVLIKPKLFWDERGYFYESFNDKEFREKVADVAFVQDNQSMSSYGVLRGMHFQRPPFAQAKLVRVTHGSVVDIAVDIRKSSETFGKWWWAYLTEENHYEFFIPEGFAHGFVSLTNDTVFQYKCSNVYDKKSEGAIAWNDPELSIPWESLIPLESIIVSEKDRGHKSLSETDTCF